MCYSCESPAFTLFYFMEINLECMQNMISISKSHKIKPSFFHKIKVQWNNLWNTEKYQALKGFLCSALFQTPSPLIILQVITSQNKFYFQCKKKTKTMISKKVKKVTECSFDTSF